MRQSQDAAIVQPAGTMVWAPLFAIICAALVAFFIAATIVLSLIPVYLSTKGGNVNINNNNNQSIATTNMTGSYSAVFRIRWMNGAPDGVTRPILAINEQYPGPLILVQQNGTVNITLINESDQETTIHWHGLLQRNTTHMDGVPGLSQCVILPGQSFQYTFSTAGQSGTYWYHSHFGVQLGDGLQGPLIIQDPNEPWRSSYTDEDLLLLTEWYHQPSYFALEIVISSDANDSIPKTGLINGIGQFNCSLTTTCNYSRIFIRPGTTKRLRIINTSLFAKITLTIDQHEMRVIEADGIAMDGTKVTTSLRINPAQRYSVLITAKENPAPSYWIRATLHPFPYGEVGIYNYAPQPNISAVLQYVTDNNTNVPIIVPSMDTYNNDAVIIEESITDGEIYSDEIGLFPMSSFYDAEFPTGGPIKTVVFNLTFGVSSAGVGLIYFNNYSFTHPAQQTVLASVLTNNLGAVYGPLSVAIEQGDIVDLVIYSYSPFTHPMHLHGHIKWLLAAGDSFLPGYLGNVTNNIVYNTVNPIARDVITLNPLSYIVLRFKADNPGIWIMHCHNDWHLNLGMAIYFVETPDELKDYYLNRTSTIPIPSTCPTH